MLETSEFIGQVRLGPSLNSFYRSAEEPDPPGNAVEVELSFAFGKRFWGQGYAAEASRAIALRRRLGFQIFPALPSGDGIVAVLDNPMVTTGPVTPRRGLTS